MKGLLNRFILVIVLTWLVGYFILNLSGFFHILIVIAFFSVVLRFAGVKEEIDF